MKQTQKIAVAASIAMAIIGFQNCGQSSSSGGSSGSSSPTIAASSVGGSASDANFLNALT